MIVKFPTEMVSVKLHCYKGERSNNIINEVPFIETIVPFAFSFNFIHKT